jgi:hypothetical protein
MGAHMNQRPPKLSRLLHQLRGIISVDPVGVRRRDLDCPRHSEVQLELGLHFRHTLQSDLDRKTEGVK